MRAKTIGMLGVLISFFLLQRNGITGWEIGNGYTLMENQKGGYYVLIPNYFQVNKKVGKFSQATAGIDSTIPAGAIKVDVIAEPEIKTGQDLTRQFSAWTEIKIGRMVGVRKDTSEDSQGRRFSEIRLFKAPGEIIVIKLDGLSEASIRGDRYRGTRIVNPHEELNRSVEKTFSKIRK